MPNLPGSHQVNMMLKSGLKLIGFIVLLSIFVCCIVKPTEADLSADYETINTYLTTNVKNSHEPSINIETARKWFFEKCCDGCYRKLLTTQYGFSYDNDQLPDKPDHCDTLAQVINSSDALSAGNTCKQEGMKALADFDSHLASNAKSQSNNYPYRRIERIIQRNAYEYSEECLSTTGKRKRLPHVFKERAYDLINSHLVNHTKSDNVDMNMASADEYLQTLIGDQEQEGVMTDALRQLMSLKSVADDERMCGGQGFEIILKNDLATGGSAHTNKIRPIRRIDKLVHHYSLKNAKLCQPVLRKKFEELLKLLDETTFRNIITLVGVQLFPQTNDTNLGSTIRNLKVGPKFFNNSMEVTELIDNEDFMNRLGGDRNLSSLIIQRSLNISAHGDPDAIYLSRAPDEVSGEYVVDRVKISGLFNKYLSLPCQQFIDTLGKQVFKLSNYAEMIDDDKSKDFKKEVSSNQGFYLAQAAYETCRMVVNNSEKLLDALIESYPPVAGKSSFYED